MTTIFVGGSRHVASLPAVIATKLDSVIAKGYRIIVGDANGADKAVQRHLKAAAYDKVWVFCSGDNARNNLGGWPTHPIKPQGRLKGFQFYAAKDRAMAHEADYGLMIWDGKSPGTVLNVLRLISAHKPAELFSVAERKSRNIETTSDWLSFLARCSDELRHDLQERATPDEQALLEHKLVDPDEPADPIAALNTGLATADLASATAALGMLAKSRGMAYVAQETGLSRESLYRALAADGNPEFSTVLKVMASLGLRLAASEAQARPKRRKAKVKQTTPDLLALLDHAT